MKSTVLIVIICLLLHGCTAPTAGPSARRPADSPPAAPTRLPTATAPVPSPTSASWPSQSYAAQLTRMPEPQNGNHTGCGDPPLPRYPQRLLYPDHADLAQSDESVSRITTFTSSATPTLILAWYDQHAHSDGWGEHRATATEREYWYVNDTCTPAFSMTIGVTTDGIRSSVTMTRRFSGPFSGWPAD